MSLCVWKPKVDFRNYVWSPLLPCFTIKPRAEIAGSHHTHSAFTKWWGPKLHSSCWAASASPTGLPAQPFKAVLTVHVACLENRFIIPQGSRGVLVPVHLFIPSFIKSVTETPISHPHPCFVSNKRFPSHLSTQGQVTRVIGGF